MCTRNIISGIVTWNHNLILCVHITSSLESQHDFVCTHNSISGITISSQITFLTTIAVPLPLPFAIISFPLAISGHQTPLPTLL